MSNSDVIEPEVSYEIVGAFLDSYYRLGYGFLESIYARALEMELIKRGLHVRREVPADVMYDGTRIGRCRFDLLVEGRIVVELKASEILPKFARRQLLNYLKATGLQLGILLHYGPSPQRFRVVNTEPGRRSQP